MLVRYSQIMLCAMLLWACTDDFAPENDNSTVDGQEAIINISLSSAPVTSGINNSRALPAESELNVDVIKDILVIEYDNNGAIIGIPKYYDIDYFVDNEVSVSVILPNNNYIEYCCVVIANTHNNNVTETLGDVSTIDKLKALKTPINVSGNKAITKSDIYMSAVMPLTRTTTSLDCDLYRNIAKLTFEIKNSENSNVKITTVTLFNVPDKSYLADKLYDNTTPTPSEHDFNFINYDTETVTIDEGESHTFEYYMPRNCRGTNSALLPSNKNSDVPDYATYFEINAVEKSTDIPLRYRFYPGANMTNDFNIVPNKHYIIPITINGAGDAKSDNRVERMDNVYLTESNCYIINPLNNESQPCYWIPLSRSNRFWESVDGIIAENSEHELENNVINESTQWVVEVIWQDQPTRLIYFCDKRGTVVTDDTYTGNGEMYFGFKPIKGTRGNVLIGVRKSTASKQSYLWSWHLWITDYNPDIDTNWKEDVYTYPVEGGAVHRYASTSWETNYRNKYVMDRNLGALSASPDDYENSRGLFWQYGSKNPIPYMNTPLYDIKGELISSAWVSGKGNDIIDIVSQKAEYFYTVIKRPTTLFLPAANSTANGNWIVHNSYESQLWYNPTWNVSESGKTFFDPSPPGWKLIENVNVWDCFRYPQSHISSNATNGKPWAIGAYNNGWNLIFSPNGDSAWYPHVYMATNNNGSNNGAAYRYIRKTGTGYVYSLMISSTTVWTYDFYLYGALSGRCIKE